MLNMYNILPTRYCPHEFLKNILVGNIKLALFHDATKSLKPLVKLQCETIKRKINYTK